MPERGDMLQFYLGQEFAIWFKYQYNLLRGNKKKTSLTNFHVKYDSEDIMFLTLQFNLRMKKI